jgi:hypothetical protein
MQLPSPRDRLTRVSDSASKSKDRLPTVYVGDDSPAVWSAISTKLTADGRQVYTPDLTNDPVHATRSVGAFKCALLHLDRFEGTADAVEVAEVLRFYQPKLPVAFLYEGTAAALIEKGRAVGPVFHVPDELDAALAWAKENSKTTSG